MTNSARTLRAVFGHLRNKARQIGPDRGTHEMRNGGKAKPLQSAPAVSVQTSPEPQRRPPPWLAEAVLILQLARDSALLSTLQQTVRVPRGRMGTFEVCDFFLVLVVYAVSGELTLLALYAARAARCRGRAVGTARGSPEDRAAREAIGPPLVVGTDAADLRIGCAGM